VKWVALALVAGLALAGQANAHLQPSPSFVEEDVVTQVVFSVPSERDPDMTAFTLVFPVSVTLQSIDLPATWTASTTGRTTTVSGGRLLAGTSLDVPVTLLSAGPAGSVEIVSEQRYADGRAVTWKVPLTVLPAEGNQSPTSYLGRAIAAGVVGLALVGGTVVVLTGRRRPD
jgi:hypothetical protein